MQQLTWRKSDNEVLDMNFWIQNSQRSLPMLSTDESYLKLNNDENPSDNQPINRQTDRFFRSAVNYRLYGKRSRLILFSGVNYDVMSYRMDRWISGTGLLPQTVSDSRVFSLDNRATYRLKWSAADEMSAQLRWLYDVVATSEEITKSSYNKSRGELSATLTWYHRFGDRFRVRASGVVQRLGNKMVSPSFSAGAEYHILPDDRLYLSASMSSNHHFPTLNDLYFQPGGNPDLRAEHSLSRETGIIFSLGKKRLHLTSELSLYSANVRDWIIWLPSWRGNWEPVNIESVKTSGVEANIDLVAKTGKVEWKFIGGYAFTRSRNFGNPENWADDSHGKQLPYIPLHSGNVNGSVSYNGWSLVYTWNYYSERFTTTSNTYQSERDSLYPYFMNQVRLAKRVHINSRSLDMSMTVYNLFNESYRSVLQRQMPGRNFLFTASLNL